jgi:hypothetical protein
MRNPAIVFVVVLCSAVWGQAQNSGSSAQANNQQSMPGMDMSGQDMSNMKDMPASTDKDSQGNSEAEMHAMHSMEGQMDMGPHMKMTALRPAKPGDAERAQAVAEAARKASERYTDYHVALAEGFVIFHPEIPQKMYHFTSRKYAIEALWHFNPDHPTSLLYEKHGDDYKLIGVMYTAPKRFSEDDLDQRIPLSVAQWHEHVNFCLPPMSMPRAEKRKEMTGPDAKFGLKGSIVTKDTCDQADGIFLPVVFNWMVHVYPFEKDQASIWSVERQHGDAD